MLYPEDNLADTLKCLDIFIRALKDIGLDPQWVLNEYVIQELEEESETDANTDTEEENTDTDKENSDAEEDDAYAVEDNANTEERKKNVQWFST